MSLFAASSTHIILAGVFAIAIAAAAFRAGHLDRGGAFAASVLGPAIVATGDLWLGILLVAFFATAALLPSVDHTNPERTWRQVVANGGPALGFAVVWSITGEWAFLIGAAATIAAAASDTWATEVGRAYGGVPWSIRTRRPAPPGTSGAISPAGTGASVAGAVSIAMLAWAAPAPVDVVDAVSVGTILVIACAGFFGNAIDTLLGATLQARFACDVCDAQSESRHPHRPDHHMHHASGVEWLTNSMVNLVSTVSAGLAAAFLAPFLQ